MCLISSLTTPMKSWPIKCLGIYNLKPLLSTACTEQCILHHIFNVIQFKYIAIVNESFYQVQGSASFPLGSCMVSPTHKFLDNSHGEALIPEDVLSYSFDIQL